MKGIIVYFSQMGNTEKVAYAIYRGLSQQLEQCDIATLTKVNTDEIDLEAAGVFGKDIVKVSHKISAGQTDLIQPLLPMYPTPKWSLNVAGGLKISTEKYRYPQCNISRDNCSWGAADLSIAPDNSKDRIFT